MTSITSIGVTAGVPTTGTGTVSTLDNLIGVAGTPNANVLTLQGASGGVAVPVSAGSLPLPAGAATAAGVAAVVTALGTPLQASGGSVTANAGTNLNTSALALETGGNLASLVSKTPALGPAVSASATPVVIASDQSAVAVVGNVAGGATDSGNGVKVSAVYNTTQPTYTAGQRADLQTDSRGQLVTVLRGFGSVNASVGANNATSATIASGVTGLNTISFGQNYNGTAFTPSLGDSAAGTWVSPRANTTGGATYAHIAAGTATTVVKASAGTLYSITFNGPATAGNTTTLYDNATGAGTVIGIPLATGVTVPTTVSFDPMGLAFANGFTIITTVANGADMTVAFK
jgi:hypothetical protein